MFRKVEEHKKDRGYLLGIKMKERMRIYFREVNDIRSKTMF